MNQNATNQAQASATSLNQTQNATTTAADGNPQQGAIAPGGTNTAQMPINAAATAMMYKQSMAILKLMQFCEALNTVSDQRSDIEFWRRIVGEYFTETANMRFSVNNGKETKVFELPAFVLPRFFQTFANSGVQRIQIHLEGARPVPTAGNSFMVDCPRISVSFHMGNDSLINSNGGLRVFYNNRLKIEILEQSMHDHNEFISRAACVAMMENFDPNNLPKASIYPFGVTEPVMRFLQIWETVVQMKELVNQSTLPNSGGPLKTFETMHKVMSNNFKQQQQQLAQQQHLQQQQEQLKQQQLANKGGADEDKSGIKQEVETPQGQFMPFQVPNGQPQNANDQMNAARNSPRFTHNTGKPFPFVPNMGGMAGTGSPGNVGAGSGTNSEGGDITSSPALANAMYGGASRGSAPPSRPSPRLGNKRRRPSAKDEVMNSPKMRPSPQLPKK